jgi:hypothetical protein
LWWLKQHAAMHGVAKQLSATKITNAAIYYYCAATLLHAYSFVREMCWWLALAKKKMWLWIASSDDPYNGEVLQYTKQLFLTRLPQMTKYFVMRECEHIGDTSIWSQEGINIFKYPKGFWRSLSEISQFCLSFASFHLQL